MVVVDVGALVGASIGWWSEDSGTVDCAILYRGLGASSYDMIDGVCKK